MTARSPAGKNLILDQSFYLARRIEVSTIEEIQQRLTEVYLTMERPTLLRGMHIYTRQGRGKGTLI